MGAGHDGGGSMDAVAVLWRSQLRRRWRAWVALALLLAIGAGTGMACLAGARRTASAFDRIAEATNYPDLQSSHGEKPADAESTIEGFEGIASHTTQVGFVGFVEDLDPTLLKYFIGSWDEPLTHAGPVLRAGRYPRPDQVDEVLVQGKGVDAAGIEPGDELTLQLFTSDFSETVAKTVVVVGTGADPLEIAADASYDRGAIYFTPAFTEANARGSRHGRRPDSSSSPERTPMRSSQPRSPTSDGPSTRLGPRPKIGCRTPSDPS